MSVCNDIDSKYIKEYKSGVKIHIVRCGQEIIRYFPFQKYGGRKNATIAARVVRDKIHLKKFGCPVTQGFKHVKKRQGSIDADLPPRLSYGKSRGNVLYVVASYTENGKVARKRYNIKKLGIDDAISLAISFLEGKDYTQTTEPDV